MVRTIILLTTELITEWLVAGSGHLTRGENLSDPVRIEAEGGGGRMAIIIVMVICQL